MKRFGYILLAGFILGCGNSTGPEPTPQYPEPEPQPLPEPNPPHIELSYESLAGFWINNNNPHLDYRFGTRVDSSFSSGLLFFGKYFLNDPYIGIRGSVKVFGVRGEYTQNYYFLSRAAITAVTSFQTPYPSSLGRDTLRSPYPEWITIKPDTILTLHTMSESYLREILKGSNVLSLSAAQFSSVLDSLKARDQGQTIPLNDSPLQFQLEYR